MVDLLARYWPVVIQITLGLSLLGIAWIYLPLIWGAPWVTFPRRVVKKKTLRMTSAQQGHTGIDLGAGDGRIVTAAARSFGARAVGVETELDMGLGPAG